MRQSEKALRDAGWEETTCGDLDKGEEFYLLGTGALLRGNLGILDAGEKVLRAPRPEPEYELGTVARVRVYSGEEFNALMDEYGFWLTVDGSYQLGSVEVLRVIAYPDGSTPWIKPMGNQVDQIKVIDGSGYGYVNTSARDVDVALEDDGRTLKIFTGGPGVAPRPTAAPRPGDSFGQYTPDADAIIERADARARELLERLWEKLDGKDDTK